MNQDSTKLDAEIEELEKLAFGIEDEVKKDEESAETSDSNVAETTTNSPEGETEETVTSLPSNEKLKERDWEREYKLLRSSTDQYKFTTRTELASLKERLMAANGEITSLKASIVVPKKDIFKDTFSKEDADTVGEDALQMMQKAATTAADANTKEIQEELKKERMLRLEADKRSIENDRAAATGIFLNKLEAILPEYKEIDKDKGFEEFIKSVDPVNGGLRLTHFKNAEDSGNVNVVAMYMREFLSTRTQKDSLEERVSPLGTKASNETTEETTVLIPVSEVDKFYADVAKNKYKGNKTLLRELEAKYDLAFSKGHINYMR